MNAYRLQSLSDTTFTYTRLPDNVTDNSEQVSEIRQDGLQQELPAPNRVLSTERSVTESVADNSDQVSEIRLGGLRLKLSQQNINLARPCQVTTSLTLQLQS